jgi:hypothetical protein
LLSSATDVGLEQEAVGLMHQMDSDRDGLISFPEFCNFFVLGDISGVPLTSVLSRFAEGAPSGGGDGSSAPKASSFVGSWLAQVQGSDFTAIVSAKTKEKPLGKMKAKMAPIKRRPLEKEEGDACEQCSAPLLPGQGTTQYGFFYCGGNCKDEHVQTTAYLDTKIRADTLSDQLGGTKKAIAGEGVQSLAEHISSSSKSTYRAAGRARQCAVM